MADTAFWISLHEYMNGAGSPASSGIDWGSNTDTDNLGLILNSTSLIQVNGAGLSWLAGANGMDIDTEGGGFSIETEDGGFSIDTSLGDIEISTNRSRTTANTTIEFYPSTNFWTFVTSGDVEIFAGSSGVIISDTHTEFQLPPSSDWLIVGDAAVNVLAVQSDSTTEVNLTTGKTFTVKDNGGSPIFTLTG